MKMKTSSLLENNLLKSRMWFASFNDHINFPNKCPASPEACRHISSVLTSIETFARINLLFYLNRPAKATGIYRDLNPAWPNTKPTTLFILWKLKLINPTWNFYTFTSRCCVTMRIYEWNQNLKTRNKSIWTSKLSRNLGGKLWFESGTKQHGNMNEVPQKSHR